MTRALVFAYHDVGVRCLEVLLRHGVEVPLVVTHADNPAENIWFGSVADFARAHRIAVITPVDPNTPGVVARVAAARPDFLFSFYYRQMLKPALLAIPPRGAYNMHGSLLPKYRGRVPVNWAIIHGETETGATLHAMTEKPDNGAIVAQEPVPIGIDDTAREVFDKVSAASGRALDRILPALIAGAAHHAAQDLSQGAYFGGRKPEDGRLDFTWPAAAIHNFVRALTRPYPGAFADIRGKKLIVWRTARTGRTAPPGSPRLTTDDGIALICADGGVLRVMDMEADGRAVDAAHFASTFGDQSIALA